MLIFLTMENGWVDNICHISLANISRNALISENTRAFPCCLSTEIFSHLCLYLFSGNDNRTPYCLWRTMLHFSNLLKAVIVFIIEQKTPPLYLWQGGDCFIEQLVSFFFNNLLVNAFLSKSRSSVQCFICQF